MFLIYARQGRRRPRQAPNCFSTAAFPKGWRQESRHGASQKRIYPDLQGHCRNASLLRPARFSADRWWKILVKRVVGWKRTSSSHTLPKMFIVLRCGVWLSPAPKKDALEQRRFAEEHSSYSSSSLSLCFLTISSKICSKNAVFRHFPRLKLRKKKCVLGARFWNFHC